MKGFDLGFSFSVDDRQTRRAFKDLNRGLTMIERAFGSVSDGVDTTSDKFERMTRTGKGANSVLGTLGSGFKGLGSAVSAVLGPFGLVFTVISKLSNMTIGLFDAINNDITKIAEFAESFGEASGGAQTLAFQLQAMGKSMEANIGATVSGWAEAKGVLKDTALATGQSADSILKLTASLSKAGLTFNDATEAGRKNQAQTEALIKAGSELATVFDQDATAVEGLLTSSRGFGLTAKDVKNLGGSMIKLQKQFGISGLGEDLPNAFAETRKNAISLGHTFDKDTTVSIVKDTAQIGAAIQKQLGGSIKDSLNSAKNFQSGLASISSDFEDVQTGISKTFSQQSMALREILSRAHVGEGQMTKLMTHATEHQSEILQLAVKAYQDAGGETRSTGRRIRKLLGSIDKDLAAALAQGGASLAEALKKTAGSAEDSGQVIDDALGKITSSTQQSTTIKRNMVEITGALSITDTVLDNLTSGSKGITKLLDMFATKFIDIQKGSKNASPALAKFAEVVNTTRFGLGPLAGPKGIIAGFVVGFQDQFENMFEAVFKDGLTFEQRVTKLVGSLGKGLRKSISVLTFGLSEEVWKFLNRKDAAQKIDEFFQGISRAVNTLKPKMQAAWDIIAKVAGPILSEAWKKLVVLLEPVAKQIKLWAAELGGQLLDAFLKMGADAMSALGDKIGKTDWGAVGLDLLIGLGNAMDKALSTTFGDTWNNFKKNVQYYVAKEDWGNALLEGLKPLAKLGDLILENLGKVGKNLVTALGLDNIGSEITAKLKATLPKRVYDYLFDDTVEKAAAAAKQTKWDEYVGKVMGYEERQNATASLRGTYLNKLSGIGVDRKLATKGGAQLNLEELSYNLQQFDRLKSQAVDQQKIVEAFTKDINTFSRMQDEAAAMGMARPTFATNAIGQLGTKEAMGPALPGPPIGATPAQAPMQAVMEQGPQAGPTTTYTGPMARPSDTKAPPAEFGFKFEIFPREFADMVRIKQNKAAANQGVMPK